MAEIELSVFSRGCLNRRISDEAELRREVAALERERNAAKSAIDWRFTTQDARRKLQYIFRQDQIETVLVNLILLSHHQQFVVRTSMECP